MKGRIQQGFERKFRALLRQVKAGKVDERIDRLLARARRMIQEQGISDSHALKQVFWFLQKQTQRWKQRHQARFSVTAEATSPPHFLCDAGLGGLARWLRAAGYQASWVRDIDDNELLGEARRLGATLITTDSMLMERRVLRDGVLPAIWVPPSLTMVEQLEMVLQELSLPVRESLCMDCGGRLHKADKEQMRERIPPRTYRWLDDYFICQQCGKLFWHGTHWQRIRAELQRLHGLPQ